MLRKIRIFLASIFFMGITLLFLDFTGVTHKYLEWMAEIQFLPALLAANVGVVLALIIITFLFGRIYCSVICPLGVMQDIISFFRSRLKKKNKFRFSYSPEKKWLKYLSLAIFFLALFAGVQVIISILAPYSAYGRIAVNLIAPIYQLGNNLAAWIAEKVDSYAFYSTEIWIKSISSLVVALLTFGILFFLAWRSGRTYCNTICPVGTILGAISRFSLFAPVIDTSKCVNCNLCNRQCKSSCINSKNHKIDYSRCVVCGDCIDICKEGAIKYKFRLGNNKAEKIEQMGNSNMDAGGRQTAGKQADGRRAFLTTIAITGSALALKGQDFKADGGLADVSKADNPERKTPIVPAGAWSVKNFHNHCTACQLCINVCPNKVLKPSTSLESLMEPQMSYTDGYCRPECVACSTICPTGAIRPITREEKSSIMIGLAKIDLTRCVVNTDDVSCGNCARHCPAGAIRMVRKDPDDKTSLRIPSVNEEKCIGCGACENLCPARPLTAIHVEGRDVHQLR